MKFIYDRPVFTPISLLICIITFPVWFGMYIADFILRHLVDGYDD